ncbi:unnamed protein product [Linum trigynum]|uniref:Uncharacterized protein n=1 Tax=Linum trigynum TaxID=586398 RepID=A0AAV2G8H4_9ROSI
MQGTMTATKDRSAATAGDRGSIKSTCCYCRLAFDLEDEEGRDGDEMATTTGDRSSPLQLPLLLLGLRSLDFDGGRRG